VLREVEAMCHEVEGESRRSHFGDDASGTVAPGKSRTEATASLSTAANPTSGV